MGYLVYNSNHEFLYGVDHFVLIYGYEGNDFYLHDPDKLPCVLSSSEQLKKAWDSDKIFYGKESYRYWTLPERVEKPTGEEIYERAIESFKLIYKNCDKKSKEDNWITGKEACLKPLTGSVKAILNPVNQITLNILLYL